MYRSSRLNRAVTRPPSAYFPAFKHVITFVTVCCFIHEAWVKRWKGGRRTLRSSVGNVVWAGYNRVMRTEPNWQVLSSDPRNRTKVKPTLGLHFRLPRLLVETIHLANTALSWTAQDRNVSYYCQATTEVYPQILLCLGFVFPQRRSSFLWKRID